MSFKKPVLPVLESKEWYDRLDKSYKQYHTHLNGFDKGVFLRMVPRSLEGMDILELGAWDGRVYEYLKDQSFHRYVVTDISPKLLSRHPKGKNVEKVICDVEQKIPFEDESFDLILSFFMFEHIDNLRDVFEEIHRLLKPGGICVIGHFIHRREFVFRDKEWYFKIRQVRRSFEQLEEFAEWAFLDHSYIDVIERWYVMGRIYKFEKN